MKQEKLVWYYLILSLTGAVLILLLGWTVPSNPVRIFDKLIVGGAFILSCILGISFAINPNWIKRYTKPGSYYLKQQQKKSKSGHHPACESFKDHTIKIKNTVLCSGCTGLALGSFASILLMGVHMIIPGAIPQNILNFLVPLGMVLIALNYIENVIPFRDSILHLVLSALLVLSFFFIVTGVLNSTGSWRYGMLGILFSFLWLDTRIQLSRWRHFRICSLCSETCKAY